MPRTRYNVVSAMYDIRPVDDAGFINIEKISDVESLLNLGRKLRIGKSGQAVLKPNTPVVKKPARPTREIIENEPESFVQPEPFVQVARKEEFITDTISEVGAPILLENSVEDLEKFLNEDINPATELVAIGGEMIRQSNARPRYIPIPMLMPATRERIERSSRRMPVVDEPVDEPVGEPIEEPVPQQHEDYDRILSEINKPFETATDNFVGEPKKMDVVDWWEANKQSAGTEYQEPISAPRVIPKKIVPPKPIVRKQIYPPRISLSKASLLPVSLPKIYLPKFKIPSLKLTSRKIIVAGLTLMLVGLFTEYGFSMRNEIMHSGNSAVQNLESAGENIKNLDFDAASTNFSQAYSDFAEAGDNLNFMGATLSSLIADLPGGSKLKSAKKLVEAGKLMADAGQAMSRAIEELAKTGLILNPTGSSASIGSISQNLRQALVLSQKNIKKAGDLLEDVDADSLPEDKRASFEEFNSKLPEFEKMITDAVDYSKFLEDFIGTAGTKKYLLMFQNPAELRPTGGFPGSYGIVVFKDGKLQDFRVDDVYNLDGQLKELFVPPLQLQHITPSWGMRDVNWFVDFPVSARKISEFYKKESGEDVDGVITFSPQIVSKILEITGPIRMDKYGVTLNSENFSQTIQEEVEYKSDKTQPKKILVDLAPLLLEAIYSADSDRWMEIFNILVSSVDGKDILMYFRDLKLQDFSVTKGFSGQVNQTKGDYLMVTLTNVKGSKTDTVIDSELKVDSIFEGDDVRHRMVLTRTHNGGGTKFGFFNKQSPTYVRMLVPDNAEFLGISGNSSPNFTPLMDYSKTDFKRDEDLVRFEEKSNYDSETGVTIYEEAGKREYGFWMILNPGETKVIELEYRVLGKADGKEYEFYIQRQPGLEFKKFTLDLISGTAEIGQSSLELKKGGGRYTFSGKLDRDLPVKIIFK